MYIKQELLTLPTLIWFRRLHDLGKDHHECQGQTYVWQNEALVKINYRIQVFTVRQFCTGAYARAFRGDNAKLYQYLST